MIYVWISLIIIIWALIAYTKSTHFKGWILEWKIDQILNQLANKYGGMAFKDLLIPFNGETSQIDNVLITDKAVYVVEAKNYRGYIYGSASDDQWTLTQKNVKTYKNRRGKKYKKTFINKHSFYNPIKQNDHHVKALNTLLKNPDTAIINIVTFGKKARLKKIKKETHKPVIRVHQLKSVINQYEEKLQKKMALNALMEMVDSIVYYNIVSKKERKTHINTIKKRYKT